MYKYLYLLCMYTFLQTATTQGSDQPQKSSDLIRRVFSSPNLAAFNSSQEPGELAAYNPESGYTVTTETVNDEVVAAAISFTTRLGELWIKSVALDPNAPPSTQAKALVSILKRLKPKRQTPMNCNIEVSQNQSNRELREVLRSAGWEQTEEYITLTKQVVPSSPRAKESSAQTQTPNFSINPFTSENLKPTLELFCNTAIFPWLNSTQEDLCAYLNSTSHVTYIARSEQQIIGALVCKLLQQRCRVALLAVHPEFQKQKVASRMLDFVTDECQHQEISTVEIKLLSRNQAALSCYLKNGFEPTQTLRAMKKLPTPGISPQLTPIPERKEGDAMTPLVPLPPAYSAISSPQFPPR